MGKIIIAPVGDNLDALFVGIRELSTDRVILIAPKDREDDAKNAKKDLEKFKIPVQINIIEGNVWEEMFKKVGQIKKLEKNKDVIVNVSTGDRNTQCAATAAAFVNGIKAFAVDEKGDSMLLPVLKFSYYKLLTEKKMDILKILLDDSCCSSLEELSKRTGMSLPLLSYHVNGTLKSEGLKELGLVDTLEERGKIDIKLSTLGRLLIGGYIT